MLKEFKDFINKGNVLELAVGVILAGAFGAIVTSFTGDVMMPLIGMFMGGVDFSTYAIELVAPVTNAAGEVTKEGVSIGIGKFIQTIIDFLIIAFVIFMVVKAYNNSKKKEEAAAPPAPPKNEVLLEEIRDLLKK